MNFMDKVTEVSKKIGTGVVDTYKVVADKSGDFFEETKMKFSISDLEDELDDICKDMGKTVYDMYKKEEDVGKVFTKECKKLDKILGNIQEMNKKIMNNKGYRVCENCMQEIKIESAYCQNCGAKQKPVRIAKEEEPVKEEKEKVCPTCGEILAKDAKFCLKCGYKF